MCLFFYCLDTEKVGYGMLKEIRKGNVALGKNGITTMVDPETGEIRSLEDLQRSSAGMGLGNHQAYHDYRSILVCLYLRSQIQRQCGWLSVHLMDDPRLYRLVLYGRYAHRRSQRHP